MDEYSGRVNISDRPGGVPYDLHQNLGVNQNVGFNDALKNIHNDNDVSRLFFLLLILILFNRKLLMKFIKHLQMNTR